MSVTKTAGFGSESGSISQRHGSTDPDPHQNVMDPQHCFPGKRFAVIMAANDSVPGLSITFWFVQRVKFFLNIPPLTIDVMILLGISRE
jgi:hypothetical protein